MDIEVTITPTINKIIKDFKEDLDIFNKEVYRILDGTLIELIKNEWDNKNENDTIYDSIQEKLKNSKNEKIIKFILNSTGFPPTSILHSYYLVYLML